MSGHNEAILLNLVCETSPNNKSGSGLKFFDMHLTNSIETVVSAWMRLVIAFQFFF